MSIQIVEITKEEWADVSTATYTDDIYTFSSKGNTAIKSIIITKNFLTPVDNHDIYYAYIRYHSMIYFFSMVSCNDSNDINIAAKFRDKKVGNIVTKAIVKGMINAHINGALECYEEKWEKA